MRVVRALTLGAFLLLVWVLPVSEASGQGDVVVLGAKEFAPTGYGWGTQKPARIFNGGDLSGLVTNIHWGTWGGAVAIGHGRNSIFKPKGGYFKKPVWIKLRARNIGTCDGQLAYTQLSFRSPRHPGGALGPWHLWSGASSICAAAREVARVEHGGPVATASFLVPRKHLTRATAAFAVREMVYRQFGTAAGDSFSGTAGGIDCRRHASPKRRACAVGWFLGDSGFQGTAAVQQKTERSGDIRVIVDWQIRHVDEYCAFVLKKPKSQCVDDHSGHSVIDAPFETQ